MSENQNTQVTPQQIIRTLMEKVQGDKITPYGIHTLVNGVMEILGNSYRVRPQMMYNYDRNGLISKGKKGAKEYTRTEVEAFVTKFTTRRI